MRHGGGETARTPAAGGGDHGTSSLGPAGGREPDADEPVTIRFDADLEGAKGAFCRGLATGETTFVVGGRERHWTWVLEQLEDCEDDLPADVCDFIGVEYDTTTYARTVKDWWNGMAFQALFLPKMLDDPTLSPVVRAAVRYDLDMLYRATGWKRPVASGG